MLSLHLRGLYLLSLQLLCLLCLQLLNQREQLYQFGSDTRGYLLRLILLLQQRHHLTQNIRENFLRLPVRL